VLAGALKDEGFTVVSTCPGWVATDMGTNPEIMKVRPARPRHGGLSSWRLAQGRARRCCDHFVGHPTLRVCLSSRARPSARSRGTAAAGRLTGGRAQTRPDVKPDLTVEESTEKHLALIHRLTTADSGKYFSAARDGAELPY